MSIDYTLSVKSDYLYLKCSGVYTQKSILEFFSTALQLTVENNLEVVLIDIRDLEGQPPTTMERYEVGSFVAKHTSLGICIVVVGKEPIIDPRRFGETVAINRGARGKVFTDMDEAESWIQNMVQSDQ